ncbi:MAG: TerB family tellurite resistance protein [Flammeovirgaceae bacterium]|nr:TerB family tellurite resistance protein [Flammeovirgaceae bacterium]
MLINLASIDGEVSDNEKKYILTIGKANGVEEHDVHPLFKNFHDINLPVNLSDDKKFDYIFSLVQLMKIDERLYKEEIRYCSRVAARLGYDQDVVFDLMTQVKSVAMEKDEINALRDLTMKFLKTS